MRRKEGNPERFEHDADERVSTGGNVRCTARSKQMFRRCQNFAVRGKDKCRFHGGATPVTTGRYSKYLKGTSIGKALDEAGAGSTSLRDEIALGRAAASQMAMAMGVATKVMEDPNPAGKAQALQMMVTITEGITGLLQTITKACDAVERAEARKSIRPADVQIVMAAIVQILESELTTEQLQRVTRRLVQVPWPAGVDVGFDPRMSAATRPEADEGSDQADGRDQPVDDQDRGEDAAAA